LRNKAQPLNHKMRTGCTIWIWNFISKLPIWQTISSCSKSMISCLKTWISFSGFCLYLSLGGCSTGRWRKPSGTIIAKSLIVKCRH